MVDNLGKAILTSFTCLLVHHVYQFALYYYVYMVLPEIFRDQKFV